MIINVRLFYYLVLLTASVFAIPSAFSDVEIKSALYGKIQTKAPGHSGATCNTKSPINYTTEAASFCKQNTVANVCSYKIPWPGKNDDPGFGCYKTFQATYTCSGSDENRTLNIGGTVQESAGMYARFDCAPKTIPLGSVTVTAESGNQTLASNGDPRQASYLIKAMQPGGKLPYSGKINVTSMVKKKSESITSYSSAENFMSCEGPMTVYVADASVGGLVLKYKATGFTNVVKSSDTVISADTQFSLDVNGTSCTGQFEYFRDRVNQVQANFSLRVNNEKITLGIGFEPPKPTATPRLISTSSYIMTRNGFISAAIAPEGDNFRLFNYNLLYLNKYGLPSSERLNCTFGSAASVPFTTNAKTGRIKISGRYTVTKDGRDSNNKMTYDVTTSLTGSQVVFDLEHGKSIGGVECVSASNTNVKYESNLGTL